MCWAAGSTSKKLSRGGDRACFNAKSKHGKKRNLRLCAWCFRCPGQSIVCFKLTQSSGNCKFKVPFFSSLYLSLTPHWSHRGGKLNQLVHKTSGKVLCLCLT